MHTRQAALNGQPAGMRTVSIHKKAHEIFDNIFNGYIFSM
jgi:hypothetical protein